MPSCLSIPLPFVCSVLQALELAELLEEEATRPVAQGRA